MTNDDKPERKSSRFQTTTPTDEGSEGSALGQSSISDTKVVHLVIICSISIHDGSHRKMTEWVEDDGDESINTIKAIVDSGVLG